MNRRREDSGHITEALMRDALFGAGTSVWEWHIQTDRLSNVDTSAALLGYAPGELESVQATWNGVIHPDDRDENHAAYLRHACGDVPIYEHEYRARTKDGAWRWIAERGRIIDRSPDGEPLRMVGTLTDITQRRLAERDALEFGERLRKIARHVPGIVYQYRGFADGSGHFPYISERCVDLLGLSPQALMADASHVLRKIEREDRTRVFESIGQAVRAMRTWRCEFRLHLRRGWVRWISATATPQRESDDAVLWHGYIEDTTDLHDLERTRQDAVAAQAANRAKTQFLSRMSHELRTPLNAVLGFAQLLEFDPREPLTDLQARRVTLIREAGDHLLRMIGELLDLTRIESGHLAVALAPVLIAPLLRECVEMVRPQADAAGVPLGLDLPGEAVAVHADATRLRQVLLNLLTNAIKYNRPGGSVRVQARAVVAEVVLEVADTGVGIAEVDLPALFEPFNRGAHRHSAIEGTGIGLAVTRALVSLMHGHLEVRSTPGVGSTFSVTLPAA